MSRIESTLHALVALAVTGAMAALIVSIAREQHQFDGVHTVGSQVYDGQTLIGVCGGKPSDVMPLSGDPSVDVTWYAECPR